MCVRLTSLEKNTDKKNGGGQSIRNTQDIFFAVFLLPFFRKCRYFSAVANLFRSRHCSKLAAASLGIFRALMETTKIEKVIKKAAVYWRSARWTVQLTVEVSAIQPQRRVVQLTRAHALHRPVPPPFVWISTLNNFFFVFLI